ncbi:hypothetical protein RBB50_011422 [Rhinocladiella similis]
MADGTLLNYLTLPNPVLDSSKSSVGPNTFNVSWADVAVLEDWADFDYVTLMQAHGHVLQQQVPPMLGTSPPLTRLEKRIFTEKTFEDVLERAIMLQVSAALSVAWPLAYLNHGPEDIAEIGRGDKARKGTAEEDNRYYADWASIRESQTTPFGYKNLCPGETKLASKWGSSKEFWDRPDFQHPFFQIQTYCGRQWDARHGYIITPEELVVVRVSKEPIGPGLAVSRSIRIKTQSREQPTHSRGPSAETVSSGPQALTLDTGSRFSDTNPDVEYGPLQFKSIPWSAEGTGKMTVKLALWWLHMETGKDVSVQNYPPSWTSDDIQTQQTVGNARGSTPFESHSSTSGPKQKGKRPARK